jgi:small GTP-binding protein
MAALALVGNLLTNLLSDWQVICGAAIVCSGFVLISNRQLIPVRDRENLPSPINRHSLQQDLRQVRQKIAQISEPSRRQVLEQKAEQIAGNLTKNQFRIALFGIGSAGKTAAINALLGRTVDKTAVTIGTTPTSQSYSYSSGGEPKSSAQAKLSRQILLVDTPGIQERGAYGQVREAAALHIAQTADLLVFVTCGDLTATEYNVLANLCSSGKRTILAFNKTDCYLPTDRELILAKLQERTEDLVLPQDIVAIAAQPLPIKVRQYNDADPNLVKEWLETVAPDIATLRQRIEEILSGEWEELLIANTHQQIQALQQETKATLQQLRHVEAEKIMTRFQAIAATTVFANPLPGLDLVANTAINTQMLLELSRLYDRPFNIKQAQKTAGIIAQSLLKFGGVEIVTVAISSCLKTNVITYAIGGSVQALSAAYLTRIGGLSFIDYLETLEPNSNSLDLSKTISTLRMLCQNNFRKAQSAEFLSQFVGSAVKQINQDLHVTAFSG